MSLATALLHRPELLSSMSRPSAWTPCCAANCGRPSTSLADAGTTLLVSSHVMDEAGECDSLLLMREGALLAQTTPAELRAPDGPRMTSARAFLAASSRTAGG